jgi:hypothetical protein
MYLLDTNVISEIRKHKSKIDTNVSNWASKNNSIEMFTSVICVSELHTGILKLENKEPPQGTAIRTWFDDQFIPDFKDRILDIDLDVAKIAAELQASGPKSFSDCLIASTAIQHNLTLVTRNVKDFRNINVKIFNPWEKMD